MKHIWMGLIAVGLALCVSSCRTVTAPPTAQQPAVTTLSPETQRQYDHYFLEAMVQRQMGNNTATFDLLQHCLRLNPNAPEAYYFLAQYYAALKDAKKSMDYIQRAAELAPDNQTYMETLAQVYVRQQDYQKAIAVVERLYDLNKDREDLLEMLYQLYEQEKDYKSAISVLERIEAIDGKSERLSMAKSDIYTRQGNKRAAIAEMKALADKYPNDLNYLAMYGESLMMNDQPKRALDVYHQILAQEPTNNRVLLSLRTYYQAIGDETTADSLTERILFEPQTNTQEKILLIRQEVQSSEATGGDSTRVLKLFRRVLSQPQTDADMALLCASYMDLKKMPRDSIRPVLEQVLTIAPDNAAARLQLVGYAWSADDKQTVIDLCQQARQYNPDEMAFYYYQGLAYYQLDSLDQSLNTFQNGVSVINDESNPDIVSDFYEVMGEILHKKGLPEQAFAAYDSCLQWKADNIGCLNNYAYYLSIRGDRLHQAEEMSYKTIKAEPKNATYLDTYAWILFMQERYSEAKIYIDQALQNIDSLQGNGVIYEHAGDIYAQNQDTATALNYWQQALDDTPSSDERHAVLTRKIKIKKYIKE